MDTPNHTTNAPFAPPLAEGADPELLALPPPPRAKRAATLALLALSIAASLSMVLFLRRDAAFAWSSRAPLELGNLAHAPASEFVSNRLVHGEGFAGAAGEIRYERPFEAAVYRLLPIAGRHDLWVELRAPSSEDSSRYVPPSSFSGRLLRFGEAGFRARGLAQAVAGATGAPLPEGAWLLLDGDEPAGARGALLLVLALSGFALWNVFAIVRLARRVR